MNLLNSWYTVFYPTEVDVLFISDPPLSIVVHIGSLSPSFWPEDVFDEWPLMSLERLRQYNI